MLNPNFRDILSEFSAANVEFLLVGAFAMAAHGLPRSTGEIDLWVRCSAENAQRVIVALTRFGPPMNQITAAGFETTGIDFQIGLPPNRIDILTGVDGVEFEEAWARRVVAHLNGLEVPVISREDLIRNKLASGRPKDVADALWLERHPAPKA